MPPRCKYQRPARIILLGRAGAGKDTVADMLDKHGFRRYAFADKIKEIAQDLFPNRFHNGEKPRRLLQDLGMAMRGLGPECWVNVLIEKIRRDRPARAVITDCRLPNELATALAEGFVPVRVVCPDELRLERLAERDGQLPDGADMQHVSETALEQTPVKYVIDNYGDLGTLAHAVDHLMVALLHGATIYDKCIVCGTPEGIRCGLPQENDVSCVANAEPKAVPFEATYVRFECGQEDRISQEFGPFPFVQLTYADLRVGPEGDFFAGFDNKTSEWRLNGPEPTDPDWYSDVIIYNK